MLNKVMIIGRLGQDPKVTYTQSGSPVCTLNVATDESYTDRDGNKVERTEWHRIIVFQRSAENCGKYLTKGSLIYVEGKLTTRKWQDKDGADRFTTEIRADRVQFLDRKGDAPQGGADSYDEAPRRSSRQSAPQTYGGSDIGSPFPSEAPVVDDVPF